MAITTLDLAVAGFLPPETFIKTSAATEAAGIFHSLFYNVGRPGAAAVPSPGVNGAALTSYAGQIPFPAAVGGKNIYLAGFNFTSNIVGTLLLCDRLWHNSGLTVTTTTLQGITSGAMPARDSNGSTNGDGLLVGIEVSTATTNGSAVTNTTLDYTNESGTARTAGGGTNATIPSTVPGGGFPATAVAGTFVPFQLYAGDKGVRSIEGITLGTSYGAGAIHLVVYRPIAWISVGVSAVGGYKDLVSSGMPRMYDNSVPFLLWMPNASTAPTFYGNVIYAQN